MIKQIVAVATLSVGILTLSLPVSAEIDPGFGRDFHNKPAGQPDAAAPMQAPMKAPEGPISEATVVSVSNGAGYSYLELEAQGKTFWLAGTQVKANKGDKVQYIENTVMENFTSRSMNKTFDRIVFASSVKVVE